MRRKSDSDAEGSLEIKCFNICHWLFVRAHTENRYLHSITNALSSNPTITFASFAPLAIVSYIFPGRARISESNKQTVDVIDMYYFCTSRRPLRSRPQNTTRNIHTYSTLYVWKCCSLKGHTIFLPLPLPLIEIAPEMRNAFKVQLEAGRVPFGLDKGIRFACSYSLAGVPINFATNYGSHYIHNTLHEVCRHGCHFKNLCALGCRAHSGHPYTDTLLRIDDDRFSGFVFRMPFGRATFFSLPLHFVSTRKLSRKVAALSQL